MHFRLRHAKEFTVTEEHVALLRHAYVSWEDCEFGAPSIDCKRPYGNSDVLVDIAEVIGIPVPDFDEDENWSATDEQRMRLVHAETQVALQIFLVTGRMETGNYVRDQYGRLTWRKVES